MTNSYPIKDILKACDKTIRTITKVKYKKKNKLIWNQTKKKHGWFWNRKYYTKEEAIKFLEQNNKKYKIIDIYFKNQLENAKAIEKSCLICRKFGNKINLTNEQIGLLIF